MNILKFRTNYFLPIVIAIVIAVSSFGMLDKYSKNYTDNSILQAGASYATARGINAIASVLQTSTAGVELGFTGSMAFGEVLDPINDMIERFSHVMSLAIGSLALQQILLGISASHLFKILIAAFGLTLITALIIKNTIVTPWLSRIFIILIFVRFSLAIVVSINSIVDNLFISMQITNGAEALNEFRDDVVKLKNDSGTLEIDRNAYEEIIRLNHSKINEINKSVLPNLKQEIRDSTRQLEEAKSNLKVLQGELGWAKRLNPFSKNKNTAEIAKKISNLNKKIEKMRSNIEANEESIKQLQEEIENSEKRLAGKPVGVMETISSGLPSISGIKPNLSLDMIGERITDAVNNIIRLSVLFILKTILIPLGFFYLFIKGVKNIWKMDLTHIISK